MGLRDIGGGGGLGIGAACTIDSMAPQNSQMMDIVPGVSGGTSLGLGITFTGLGTASFLVEDDKKKSFAITLIGIGLGLIFFSLVHTGREYLSF